MLYTIVVTAAAPVNIIVPSCIDTSATTLSKIVAPQSPKLVWSKWFVMIVQMVAARVEEIVYNKRPRIRYRCHNRMNEYQPARAILYM